MPVAVMVVEGDIELISKSIDDGGADTQASKRSRAREESDFGNVMPISGVFLEFVVNETEDFFSHGGFELLLVSMIVELEEALVRRGVEIEFHALLPVEIWSARGLVVLWSLVFDRLSSIGVDFTKLVAVLEALWLDW